MQSDDDHEKAPKPDPTSSLEPTTPERRSLLSRFGGPSNPGGVLSKPTGPIMADPAWVFEERPAAVPGTAEQDLLTDGGEAPRRSVLSDQKQSDAIAALIAEVDMARAQDARQTAQEPPGEALSGEEQAE